MLANSFLSSNLNNKVAKQTNKQKLDFSNIYAFVDRGKLDIISNLVRDFLHLERVREMKVAQMKKRYHKVH